MKALAKTLFGDRWNLLAVAAILALEAVLAACNALRAGAWLVPVAVLAAVAWLARR